MASIQQVFRMVEIERCCRDEACGHGQLAPSLSAYLLELQQLIRKATFQLHQHGSGHVVVSLIESAACATACMERHGAPARRRGRGEPEWLGESTGLDTDMVYAIIEEECEHMTIHRCPPVRDLPTLLLDLQACLARAARDLNEENGVGDGSATGRPARCALHALATVRVIAALTVVALTTCRLRDSPGPPLGPAPTSDS